MRRKGREREEYMKKSTKQRAKQQPTSQIERQREIHKKSTKQRAVLKPESQIEKERGIYEKDYQIESSATARLIDREREKSMKKSTKQRAILQPDSYDHKYNIFSNINLIDLNSSFLRLINLSE